MHKLFIHGEILSAAEALERAEAKFALFRQEGNERLRLADIEEMRALLRRIDRSRRMLVGQLGAFETIAEKVEAVAPEA